MFPAELQISAIGKIGNIMISKLFERVDKIEREDQQTGLKNFGFGTGSLLSLKDKIPLEEELQIMTNGKMSDLPKSTYEIPTPTSLASIFKGDEFFMTYAGGHTTFGECGPATWFISLDMAFVTTDELKEFPETVKPDFLAKSNKDENTTIFQNRDPTAQKDKPKALNLQSSPSPLNLQSSPPPPPLNLQSSPPPPPPLDLSRDSSSGVPPLSLGTGSESEGGRTAVPLQLEEAAPPSPSPTPVASGASAASPSPVASGASGASANPYYEELPNPYSIPAGSPTTVSSIMKDIEQEELQEQQQKSKIMRENQQKALREQKAQEEQKNLELLRRKNEEENKNIQLEKRMKEGEKFEVYKVPEGKEFGDVPDEAVWPWELDKIPSSGYIETKNQKYFPKILEETVQWTTLYYIPSKILKDTWVPCIIRTKKNGNSSQSKERLRSSYKIWNPFTRDFSNVDFEKGLKPKSAGSDHNNEAKNKERSQPIGTESKEVIKTPTAVEVVGKKPSEPEKKKAEDQFPMIDTSPMSKLFDNCDDGIARFQLSKGQNEELKKELVDKCNLKLGEKINGYVPLVADVSQEIGGLFGTLLRPNALAQVKVKEETLIV